MASSNDLFISVITIARRKLFPVLEFIRPDIAPIFIKSRFISYAFFFNSPYARGECFNIMLYRDKMRQIVFNRKLRAIRRWNSNLSQAGVNYVSI